MTYNCVNEILENNNVPEGYEPYVDNLKLMLELSNILRHTNTEFKREILQSIFDDKELITYLEKKLWLFLKIIRIVLSR